MLQADTGESFWIDTCCEAVVFGVFGRFLLGLLLSYVLRCFYGFTGLVFRPSREFAEFLLGVWKGKPRI